LARLSRSMVANMVHPQPPLEIAEVMSRCSGPTQRRLLQMRELIFRAAVSTGTAPLTEDLKWGEPAHRPRSRNTGTTVRLGWRVADPDRCALYVPCLTDLVSRYRDRFPHEFTYGGDRAVYVPVNGSLPGAALQ
jgi:hypothetical protein